MPYPVEPPKEFFDKPDDLVPGYGTTVTDDGHVYGYLALFNARLIGSGSNHTKPPRSRSNYAYANSYQTKTSDGSIVRTGVLSGTGGHHKHPDIELMKNAYADTAVKIANVVYGEDAHGVWFSGAVVSDASDADVQNLRSSGVSGHWERPEPGKPHELIGACCVNIPGFPQASNHRIIASANPIGEDGLVVSYSVEADSNKNHSFVGAGSNITASATLNVTPISGVLAVLDTPTSDNRIVRSVEWNELPLPLWSLNEQGIGGHCGARIIGRITNLSLDGSVLHFEGEIEQSLDNNDETQTVINLGVLGVSMDGYPPTESDYEEVLDADGWVEQVIFNNYRITGATLTSQPAFIETMGVSSVSEDSGNTNTDEDNKVSSSVEEEAADDVIVASASSETIIKLPIIWQ